MQTLNIRAEIPVALLATRLFCGAAAGVFLFQFTRLAHGNGVAAQYSSYCYLLASCLVLVGFAAKSASVSTKQSRLFAGFFAGLCCQSVGEVILLSQSDNDLALLALYGGLTLVYAFLAAGLLYFSVAAPLQNPLAAKLYRLISKQKANQNRE